MVCTVSTPLLIDTDPGNDDAVLIALALASDEFDVIGLTTVAGNETIGNTTRNARSVLELLDRTDVPVAEGCGRPLVDEPNTADVHGPGGLYGAVPEPGVEPIEDHAVRFVLDQVRRYGDELRLLAVGPLTNVALALAIEPELPEMIDGIHVMGGAATTTGNVTPAAEFNFHHDPAAASRVVQDGTPSVVGLDVTDRATVPAGEIEELARGDEPGRSIACWLAYASHDELLAGLDESRDRFSVHDAVVIADLLGDVLTFEDYYLEIDTSGGPSHGSVVCDTRGVTGRDPNATVAVEIDTEEFRSVLFDTLDELV
ncbi:nucleoside hydrolase [Halobacteriales archaeon QH_6_64_20]|nr:MAG: nucleoside hydrolase [Halobacteriales archaeon QH_6_64_20]